MIAIRFMSNLHLAVEKVTESLLGNIKVKVSFGLAASDKRREGVARSVGPLLTLLFICLTNATDVIVSNRYQWRCI